MSCVYNSLRIAIMDNYIQPVKNATIALMSSRIFMVVPFEVYSKIGRHDCASGATMAGLVTRGVSANESEISRI